MKLKLVFILTLLLCGPAALLADVSAVSAARTAVDEARTCLADLPVLAPDGSIESSAGTTAASAAADLSPELLLATSEFASLRLKEAQLLYDKLSKVPRTDKPIDFFRFREELLNLSESNQRKADIATEQASLAASSSQAAKAALARERALFFRRQAMILDSAVREMNAAWKAAYSNPAKRKSAEARALKAISDAKAAHRQEAVERAEAEAAKLVETRKQALELAKKAKEELKSAKTGEERELARLRHTYATLKIAAEEQRIKATKAEIEMARAEELLTRTRAELARQLPLLRQMAPGTRRVVDAHKEWLERVAKLKKNAKIIEKEIELAREAIPEIRRQGRELSALTDRLEDGLSDRKNKKNKNYRLRVFFARRANRRAAVKLDQFRTLIEYRERTKNALLACSKVLESAAEEIEQRAEKRYFGQTADQWQLFILGLVITLIVTIILHRLVNFLFHRVALNTQWNWDNIAMEEMALPLRILLSLAGLWFSFKVLSLGPGGENILGIIAHAIKVAWLGLFGWRLVNTINRVLEPKFKDTESTLDDQLLRFCRSVLRMVIIVFTVLYILEAFGWQISSLLAGLGIGGLAFALAAKDTVANLFGSIVLFIDRPFRVGNWVKIGDAEGIVEDIGIRSTRIRTFKDTMVTIPNANVANTTAENIHSFRKRRLYFTFELRKDTPTQKVKDVIERLRRILKEHPMILDGFFVYLTGITAHGIKIMVYCFVATRDWQQWLIHSQEIYLSLLDMLEEVQVELAFPTQTLEIEKGLVDQSPFKPAE